MFTLQESADKDETFLLQLSLCLVDAHPPIHAAFKNRVCALAEEGKRHIGKGRTSDVIENI